MVMNRESFPKQLERGLNTVFGMEYARLPEQWRQCFESYTSRKAYEEDVIMTGFGAAPQRTEGAPVEYDEGREAWTARYVHNEDAMAFAITQVALEDNLYTSLAPRYARALSRAMGETKEIRGAAIFNRSHDPAYPGGDGQPLCSAVHPLVGGGTASNIPAAPADFAETSLEALLIQIRKAVDDRHVPINLNATDVLIPEDTAFDAVRLLNSQYRPGDTIRNDVNAIKQFGFFQRGPLTIRRMVDPDWWGVKTDVADGLKHFSRIRLNMKSMGSFETDNFCMRARCRYSFGWSDWRAFYGSEGA